MATEKNNINKPTRKRKKTAQDTGQQQADAPNLTPIGAELAQNADDEGAGNGAKASREWDPHMGARQDTPKTFSVPAQPSDDNTAFNDYLSTLPDNQRDSKNFNVRRYWELNGRPKNFDEAVSRGMFTMDDDDNMWHAGTVAYNQATDEYEFMKSPDHPTIGKEVDTYNNSPEMDEFRKNYYLDQSSTPWKYKRRHDAPVVMSQANVPQRTDGTYKDEASDRSGAADAVNVPQPGVENGDAQISENLGTISQGGDVAEDKKSAVSRVSMPSNDAKLRERYDTIQRENAALQQKKDGIAGISSIVKTDSASAEQLSGAVDAIDAQVAENDNGIAEMFADDAQNKSEQKKEEDAFAKRQQEAEAIQSVRDIDWNDDAQVEGLDKDTVRVAMADAFPDTRVDLWNRPHVPSEDMRKAGYDVPDGSSASVYSMGFDVDGKEVLVTPIVDNGDGTYTVMSEDEVARYVGSLNPADPESDELGLVISWDSKPDDGYKLHKMQEAFYATPQLVSSNGERLKDEPQEKASQDSEEKGTTEEKGGDGDAENDMSFWLKPDAAVEPDEPYLDLKSAEEYGISEDNGEDVEEEVEGGTIRYKDYSKADKEAYARLNEEEKKRYDEIMSYISYYEAARKAARDDNNLAEVLEANRLMEQYEAEKAELEDPDKLKKRRARRSIAMFADVLSAIANMWGAYRGAKPIELKSATGAIGDAEAAEDKSLKERLKEYAKLADTAKKAADKEIARLDKVDAAELAAVRKRLLSDFKIWKTSQERIIENAKKKRDTSNQKKRDAQYREIRAKNQQKRTQENIDYRADVSDKSDAKRRARADKYKQKAEARDMENFKKKEDYKQKNKKDYNDYINRDEE